MHTDIEEANLEIQRLKAQIGRKHRKLTIKVSQKGGISVAGLQKFPTTLYANQWSELLSYKEEILQFIEENRSVLAIKE